MGTRGTVLGVLRAESLGEGRMIGTRFDFLFLDGCGAR